MRNLILSFVFVFICSTLVSAAEYDRILNEMRSLAQEHPQTVQMFDLGRNDQGNMIYGLRMEATSNTELNKVNHLLVGTHHGNERKSADLSMKAADKLVKILKDPNHDLHSSLSSKVFFVVPVLNIGGFNRNSRRERDSNGYSLDPNRDYPDPCIKNQYFRLASIRNLVNFVETNNIVAAVTVHGYIGTFTYPWGIYTNDTHTADHAKYASIARECCEINNYRHGTHTDVIYPAAGAFEDWCYHQHGTWTMLLELSYYPDLSKDADAVLTFFALAPTEKSKQHKHNGKCTKTYETEGTRESQGRP